MNAVLIHIARTQSMNAEYEAVMNNRNLTQVHFYEYKGQIWLAQIKRFAVA